MDACGDFTRPWLRQTSKENSGAPHGGLPCGDLPLILLGLLFSGFLFIFAFELSAGAPHDVWRAVRRAVNGRVGGFSLDLGFTQLPDSSLHPHHLNLLHHPHPPRRPLLLRRHHPQRSHLSRHRLPIHRVRHHHLRIHKTLIQLRQRKNHPVPIPRRHHHITRHRRPLQLLTQRRRRPPQNLPEPAALILFLLPGMRIVHAHRHARHLLQILRAQLQRRRHVSIHRQLNPTSRRRRLRRLIRGSRYSPFTRPDSRSRHQQAHAYHRRQSDLPHRHLSLKMRAEKHQSPPIETILPKFLGFHREENLTATPSRALPLIRPIRAYHLTTNLQQPRDLPHRILVVLLHIPAQLLPRPQVRMYPPLLILRLLARPLHPPPQHSLSHPSPVPNLRQLLDLRLGNFQRSGALALTLRRDPAAHRPHLKSHVLRLHPIRLSKIRIQLLPILHRRIGRRPAFALSQLRKRLVNRSRLHVQLVIHHHFLRTRLINLPKSRNLRTRRRAALSIPHQL